MVKDVTTDSNGYSRTRVYNEYGDVIQEDAVNIDGTESTKVYYEDGSMNEVVTYPYGKVVTYYYLNDYLEMKIEEHPDGTVVVFEYYENGNVASETVENFDGTTIIKEYDENGSLIREKFIDADGNEEITEY